MERNEEEERMVRFFVPAGSGKFAGVLPKVGGVGGEMNLTGTVSDGFPC